MFKKTITILALLPLLLMSADLFEIAPSGDFSIGGQRFFLLHRDGGWRSMPQDRNSAIAHPGFPKKENGQFHLKGNYRSFAGSQFEFNELIQFKNPSAIHYQAHFSSSEGVDTKMLALSTNLNLNEFQGKKLLLDGKPIGFGDRLDPKNWAVIRAEQPTTLELPLKNGILTISGTFAFKLQDERQFNLGRWALWLYFTPNSGVIHNAQIELQMVFQPYRSIPVDLHKSANMGFADSVADDGKGGWTDQGPENDLRTLTPGTKNFAGVQCRILDPATNHGRSCLLLGGRYRPKFPLEASLSFPRINAKNLYLLHAAAWEQPEGTPLGSIEVSFADGSRQNITLSSGIDINNFWNPVSRKNAAVVWTDANQSARVGLYLSKFPLKKNAGVTALKFHSAGNAVWLIVAATLSPDQIPLPTLRPVVLAADADWKVIDHPGKVKAGSVLDFSNLLDAPAGKHGFIRFDKGYFSFGDNSAPVRFWGANICQEAQFMEDAALEKIAADYVRYGYNFVRFHQYDHRVHKVEGKKSTALDPVKMNRLDKLAAELKKRGVYWTIDLYSRRILPAGELPEFPDSRVTMEEFKALVYVSENAMRNWEEASANFLNHVNPYTGLAWKDDPALISISLINEDTGFAVWNRNPRVAALYEAKFKEYCAKHDLTVTPANHDRYMREFLNETQRTGYARMKKFLRSLGVKAALNSQNYWNQAALALSRNDYDMVDNHFYWGHPEFLGKNWSLPAVVASDCAVRRFGGSLAHAFPTRIFGKPFTITEWDFVNPGAYATEGAFLVGAYASLQGWDGLCRFTYTHDPKRIRSDEHPIFLFDIVGDPLRSLSERAGTLFYLRGDVKTATESYSFTVAQDYLRKAENPEFYPPEIMRAGLIGRVGTSVTGSPLPADVRSLPQTAGKTQFTSSTGELTLLADKGIFSAVTPRSEGFILPEKESVHGKFASLHSLKSWSSILVASVENLPLEKTGRLLLLHLTEAKNNRMRFADPQMTLIEDWGSTPQLMRHGQVELTLNRDMSRFKLYAVGFDGSRLFELPFEVKDGKTRLLLDNHRNQRAIAAYELTIH